MFNLDDKAKYWLYTKPVDMRKSFNGLSGIVTNAMCANFRNGDVYIFMNASRSMIKILRQEECGLVLYAMRPDMGRIKSPATGSDEELLSTDLTYDDLVRMVQSAMNSPYVRRMKLLTNSL